MTNTGINPYPWLDKLADLNILLTSNDITVSVDVWVRVYDLFIAQYQQGRLPQDPAKLESALSGLIANSAEQQQQFKSLYQQWLIDIGSVQGAQAKQYEQNKLAELLEAETESQRKQRKNKSWIKVATVAALLLVSILAVAIYFWPEKEAVKPLKEPIPQTSFATTAPISVNPIMALQPTPLRQDLLPKAVSNRQDYLLDVIGKTLPWLPLGVFVFFLWAKWQRWQEVLSQQKGDPTDPLNFISLPNETASSKNLFSSPLLASALRALHNPMKASSQALDMKATIEATAQEGGYFTPKYQQRSYIPPCIMMISYQHGQDQASGLALLMQQRLVHAGLEVHTYLFQGTPEHLYTLEGMNSTSLEEVTQRYPQGNLLLVSDPDIYLSAWSGQLQPWANAIGQWQQRALLTTRPTTSAMRQVFDALQLHSASLSSEGLKQISQTLAGVRKASDINIYQKPLPPVLARLNAYECGEDISDEDKEEQIDALHLFCDPQTFRLLSVVAAYPELHWPLTQRIESKLFSEQNMEQRELRLLTLLRLPWLRVGRIPRWLRLYCYQQQNAEHHQKTKEIYLELFHDAEIDASGNNKRDHLHLPFNANSAKKANQLAFIDWLKTLKKAQESTLEESLWDDQIFLNTLWGKPKDLDVPLTKRLAVRLPKGRWGRLYPRIALWSTAALLLGVVLQLGWESKGRSEFQALLPPVGLSTGLASTNIEILINKPESYETGAQLLQFEQQKQAAKLLTEALKQQGVTGEINTNISTAAASDQVSRISYNTAQQELAALAAKQLVHLTWGNAPELSATLTNDILQIQLNRLTQAASTFSDQASIKTLTEAQKLALATPISNENPAEIQAFTLFSDTSKGGIPLPQMVALPAGTFLMGSPETEPERRSSGYPQHDVTISAFAISQTEVTFEQYDAFADASKREKPRDEGWGRGLRPVINVIWSDAKAYTVWLSEQTGQEYRLPSESEWEYAARAGSETVFSTGNCNHVDWANYNGDLENNSCGIPAVAYRGKTTEVSKLAPNPWGIYAMSGNVWEWVEDCYEIPSEKEGKCTGRTLRGGGWNSLPNSTSSAYRSMGKLNDGNYNIGFRIVRDL